MVIKRCTCKSDWQDKVHGKEMRAMNPMAKDKTSQPYRCSVCEKVHS